MRTLMSPAVRVPSPADCQQMARHGYVVIRSLLHPSEVATLLRWTAELESAPEVSGRHWVYHERSLLQSGRSLVQRIENFCPFHPMFDRFVREGELIRWVRTLMDGRAVLFKDKINLKLPGGGGFKAHQDQQAGWSRYAPLFVTAMVTLDAATVANGCLKIATGRRRERLIGAEWTPLDESGLELTPIATNPGDVIFFDSYVPHSSEPNLTGTARRVLYLTYNLASAGDHRARYFADKHLSLPPDIDRDPHKTYEFRV